MPETPVQSWETWIWFLHWKVPLEEEIVTHYSILAWKILWTEEREGLQSMASQCRTWLRRHASHMHKYRANFFMSPYTPDLKHNSSTRSKNFQTLPLGLAFFFLLWPKHRWDPNRDLIASNIRIVQGGWFTYRSVEWRLVGPLAQPWRSSDLPQISRAASVKSLFQK